MCPGSQMCRRRRQRQQGVSAAKAAGKPADLTGIRAIDTAVFQRPALQQPIRAAGL
jgi:hypothetical protein